MLWRITARTQHCGAWRRATFGGFRAARDGGKKVGRPERLLQIAGEPSAWFKSVHSRHKNVEEQQIEISDLAQCQALSPVTGGDYIMPGALQQQTDDHLDRHIIIHDEYHRQIKRFSGPRWNQVTAGCKFCRIRVLPQLLQR